jgi:hypothetical protein
MNYGNENALFLLSELAFFCFLSFYAVNTGFSETSSGLILFVKNSKYLIFYSHLLLLEDNYTR